MQFFYDGQIRRYLTQTIRLLSNFTVKYGDGTLVRIPVMYGDMDKQVANIISQGSENTVNSTPRIAVYISGLSLDRDRLADATHIGKLHIRERDYADGVYNQNQGRNYTVERLMPTPYKLTMKVDIWAASTDQKLQILEQVLVLFNPSLELQTTDNYIDWTSLSVLNLTDLLWSSRSVPVGTNSAIDIATMTLDTPIWISPPAKVKHLGVITTIITSIFESADTSWSGIDGLGNDLTANGTTTLSSLLAEERITITDYQIQVYGGQAILLGATENVVSTGVSLEIPIRQGTPITWDTVLAEYPGKFIPGASKLFLPQLDGTEVIGTVAILPEDPTILIVNWDPDTYPRDTLIDSNGLMLGDIGFDQSAARGTFDAIIDPTKVYPGHGMTDVVSGDRFLIIEDITTAGRTYDGEQDNNYDAGTQLPGVFAWGNFNAKANDIIEWQTDHWVVIFEAAQESDTLIHQTNIYNSKRVQYRWNGVSWVKSFEGEYKAGKWRLEL